MLAKLIFMGLLMSGFYSSCLDPVTLRSIGLIPLESP